MRNIQFLVFINNLLAINKKGHIRRCDLELVVKEGLEPSTPGL